MYAYFDVHTCSRLLLHLVPAARPRPSFLPRKEVWSLRFGLVEVDPEDDASLYAVPALTSVSQAEVEDAAHERREES